MSISTPYGLKSLVECLSRATLLAQPDDIPSFLSTHVKKMLHTRGEGLEDIKEVAFPCQEQWENVVLHKYKSSASLMVSHPSEAGEKTSNKSSVRILSQQQSVCPAAEVELFPLELPTVRMCEVPSVMEEKSSESLPSKFQKAQVSKQMQGQKSAKMPTCRLSDCPYHDKHSQKFPATMGLEPVRASTKSETKIDLELQKSKGEPRSFDLPFSYRPKGGYLIDPELVPERVRTGPVANRQTSAAESALLCSRYGAPYRKQGRLHQRNTNHSLTKHLDLEHKQVTESGKHSRPFTKI